MTYRCRRNAFTQGQYELYANSFWAVPSDWANTNRFADFWKAGGLGLISVLPVLGQYAHSTFASELFLSKEEIARLAGLDSGTVTVAQDGLDYLGLAKGSHTLFLGERSTVWHLSQHLAAPRTADRFVPDYFYFSSRLIYGGNWAKLRPVQRALYLAIGVSARSYDALPTETHPLYVETRRDIEHCYDELRRHHTRAPELPWLRLVSLPISRLVRMTGISRSAIQRALQAMKHPDVWPDARNDAAALRHCPLGIYPSRGSQYVFHLRDHAPHWPWEQLNGTGSIPQDRFVNGHSRARGAA